MTPLILAVIRLGCIATLSGLVLFAQEHQIVVGGEPARNGELFSAFSHPVFSDCRGSCGGTLIHPDIVLSVARCQGVWLEAGQVAIGALDICGLDAKDTIQVDAEYNHPLYDEFSIVPENDIALIRLSRPTTTIAPASWNSNPSAPVENGLVEAWAFLMEDLYKIPLKSVPTETCKALYDPKDLYPDFGQEILCAGAEENTTCYGESGGPLSLAGDDNTVVGISSSSGCVPNHHRSIFTRVSAYDIWIKKTICSVSAVSPETYSCDDFCGDLTCDSFEDCKSCPNDCGLVVCPPFLGDGICGVGESCQTSPADCGPCTTAIPTSSCPVGINLTGLAVANADITITNKLEAPAGQSIACSISGGTGDADLSITLENFTCNSDNEGNDESCTTPGATEPTMAVVEISAASNNPFSDVDLVCACNDFDPRCGDGFCTAGDETCVTCHSDCGDCVCGGESGIIYATGLSSRTEFNISVPLGQNVTCWTSGGTGNVLMEMIRDGFPSCISDKDIDDSLTLESCTSGPGTVTVVLAPVLDSFLDVSLECICDDYQNQYAYADNDEPEVPFPLNILGSIFNFLFIILVVAPVIYSLMAFGLCRISTN